VSLPLKAISTPAAGVKAAATPAASCSWLAGKMDRAGGAAAGGSWRGVPGLAFGAGGPAARRGRKGKPETGNGRGGVRAAGPPEGWDDIPLWVKK